MPSRNSTMATSQAMSQSASLAADVREHLDRLLHSQQFDASTRSREFLCFVVEKALTGHVEELNQIEIAMSVFGRKADFDGILDPVVRVQAGRLRRSLERYYLLTGDTGLVRIDLPKGSYVPSFTPGHPEADLPSVTALAVTEVVSEWPAIVIHRLASSTQDDEPLAVRVEDELISEICRYGDVRVMRQRDFDKLNPQRQAAVRFELRGRLRRVGDDHLVSAQLSDRMSGEQVWSDEYHTSPQANRWSSGLDDIARVVAARIASEQGVIARRLAAECRLHPLAAGDSSAIHHCYRFFFMRDSADLLPTRQALEKLTQRQPDSAVAWAYLARLYQIDLAFELSDQPAPIDKAISCAYQGLLLDPGSSRVRCVLAVCLLLKDELQTMRRELQQALRLNPDSLAYREIIGWLLALAGEWDAGIGLMREAMQLNPYCLPHVQHGLWADHMRRGEVEQAYTAALEYRDPSFFWRHLMMASCLGYLGRRDDAASSVQSLLAAKPDFPARGRILIGHYIKNEALRECVIEGLRRANPRVCV